MMTFYIDKQFKTFEMGFFINWIDGFQIHFDFGFFFCGFFTNNMFIDKSKDVNRG